MPTNQPKHPSTDDCIKQIWYIYTVEYYSPIKKNGIMSSAVTWMELEAIKQLRNRISNTAYSCLLVGAK